jgi:NAD(P)-dependent dehydrogenase (short-subunit alcohol dehydrogenase family)
MHGKTVIVTGGNTGLGKATATGLAKLGADVIFTSRDASKGAKAKAEIEAAAGRSVRLELLDLASFASIRAFAARILETTPKIDVLVNNAGLILDRYETTDEGFETTFGVNHLGHFLLTQLLLPRIEESAPARVVVLASDAHYRAKRGLDWDDLMGERRFRGFDAYAKSKLANVMFARELARRLEGTGVTVNAVHPGVVATEFAGKDDAKGPVGWFFRMAAPLLRTPERGAETTIYVASSPEVEGRTGRYFADKRDKAPSRHARDDAGCQRLWAVSEALVGRVVG